ncbi:MAG: LysR substrate-binding domain-containing protein [Pseudomonadota bacterium]
MTDWLPSLNALRAFGAVARHLSYRKAAEELSVTPAAVKQLVSKLEAAVGAPLLRRDGRALALTAAGEAGRDDVARGMEHLTEAVAKMRAASVGRRLIVTAEASLATAWLAPKLADFKAAHPEINVLLDSSQDIVDLAASDADVAIRYGAAPGDGRSARRLFPDEIFAACSPALAETIRAEGIGAAPLIHWDLSLAPQAANTRRWFAWSVWFEAADLPAPERDAGLRFSDYNLAVQAAVAGQGLVLASWPILRDTFEAGLLVSPFETRVVTDIGYDAIVAPGAEAREEARAFVDWLLATAAKESGQLRSGRGLTGPR